MLRYVIRRILLSVPMMLGILFLTFFLLHLVPGNPLERALGEQGATPEARARLVRELGMDRPWYLQFASYCAGLLRGDLGKTLVSGESISQEMSQRLPNTCLLATAAVALATVLGVTTGVLSAVWPGSLVDHACRVVAVVGISTPAFWSGLMLMLFFSLRLGWLPATSDTPNLAINLILPAVTLAMRPAGFIQRVTRSTLLDILKTDYIRTARAMGLMERTVILRHAMRNAAIPIVTLVGLDLGSLLSGAVITEPIFHFKGIGLYALKGIQDREPNIVMATVLAGSFVFVLANLAVDLLYAVLDPRIRHE